MGRWTFSSTYNGPAALLLALLLLPSAPLAWELPADTASKLKNECMSQSFSCANKLGISLLQLATNNFAQHLGIKMFKCTIEEGRRSSQRCYNSFSQTDFGRAMLQCEPELGMCGGANVRDPLICMKNKATERKEQACVDKLVALADKYGFDIGDEDQGECCQREEWTGKCTLCPGNLWATCRSGYKQSGQKGCGFLNAGCEIKCRNPCYQRNQGCGCGQGIGCLKCSAARVQGNGFDKVCEEMGHGDRCMVPCMDGYDGKAVEIKCSRREWASNRPQCTKKPAPTPAPVTPTPAPVTPTPAPVEPKECKDITDREECWDNACSWNGECSEAGKPRPTGPPGQRPPTADPSKNMDCKDLKDKDQCKANACTWKSGDCSEAEKISDPKKCKKAKNEAACDKNSACKWTGNKCGVDAADACKDVEEWSFDGYEEQCKGADNKKACTSLGCKYKKNKCTALTKKIKCKKVAANTCCYIPGCSKGKKKCEGKFTKW